MVSSATLATTSRHWRRKCCHSVSLCTEQQLHETHRKMNKVQFFHIPPTLSLPSVRMHSVLNSLISQSNQIWHYSYQHQGCGFHAMHSVLNSFISQSNQIWHYNYQHQGCGFHAMHSVLNSLISQSNQIWHYNYQHQGCGFHAMHPVSVKPNLALQLGASGLRFPCYDSK